MSEDEHAGFRAEGVIEFNRAVAEGLNDRLSYASTGSTNIIGIITRSAGDPLGHQRLAIRAPDRESPS